MADVSDSSDRDWLAVLIRVQVRDNLLVARLRIIELIGFLLGFDYVMHSAEGGVAEYSITGGFHGLGVAELECLFEIRSCSINK
eukprot:CAMPEP_0185620400 /NCGR_PEP_ID=MMETSP0436-20130131/53913_1 /TAXON_ID=626734 ORGANISM="Favella taraikaensis, Strain Fe Narragansett Bay" /NCGR_SAMPLE_ID=MMETSP0436 /ASSEMBLY_ACC=CAM_ASM_000390 /LENGTH=83 /DNA_ID=CAMNT_0028260761 /DNA_START=894 /DNA_END=1142 /DNA_ORIENTATION=-